MKTKEWLLKNRAFPNIKGFNYLIDAVELVENGEKSVMKIYEIVANKYKMTASIIERAIRYLIETRLNTKAYKGYMNNGEIIFYLAEINKKGEKKNEQNG